MNKEEMNKYAYECMVKNNSDEAVKQLLLKDKTIERLNNIINEVEQILKNDDLCHIEKLREIHKLVGSE